MVVVIELNTLLYLDYTYMAYECQWNKNVIISMWHFEDDDSVLLYFYLVIITRPPEMGTLNGSVIMMYCRQMPTLDEDFCIQTDSFRIFYMKRDTVLFTRRHFKTV
uniref:Neur_chan_LBD domain-containing protein n=1 Tax=Syphacia muris TaxID=451379 RepID=A0A0N5AGZ8_9BILA